MRIPIAAAAALAATPVFAGHALAYQSGTVGYDVSYPQCGTAAPASRFIASRTTASTTTARTTGTWWSVQRHPSTVSAPKRTWYTVTPIFKNFGIIGVDQGAPFANSPGNPCLAREYSQAPNPGLYLNTGFDPSYVTNHMNASCQTQSAAVNGTQGQRDAWTVGCSEVVGDYAYTSSQGIASAAGWWLDVETANSWCGLHGVNCDQSFNQFALQGMIDELSHIGAVPIGIYSNNFAWSSIMGALAVTGATADWYASGTSSVQQAKAYCSASYRFSGSPVTLVQFFGTIDQDYAC